MALSNLTGRMLSIKICRRSVADGKAGSKGRRRTKTSHRKIGGILRPGGLGGSIAGNSIAPSPGRKGMSSRRTVETPPCDFWSRKVFEGVFVAFEDFLWRPGFGLEDYGPSSLGFREGLLVVVYFSSRYLQWSHHHGDHLRRSSMHHRHWWIDLDWLNCEMMTSQKGLGLKLVEHLVMSTLVVDLPLGTFFLKAINQ